MDPFSRVPDNDRKQKEFRIVQVLSPFSRITLQHVHMKQKNHIMHKNCLEKESCKITLRGMLSLQFFKCVGLQLHADKYVNYARETRKWSTKGHR